jgi:AP-1 complex subunit mu
VKPIILRNYRGELGQDNFAPIYKLLNEVIDHEYPRTTDEKLLKEYIKEESNILKTLTGSYEYSSFSLSWN